MYVCVHMYVYVCVCVSLHVFICVCVYGCMCLCVRVYMCECIGMGVYVRLHACVAVIWRLEVRGAVQHPTRQR